MAQNIGLHLKIVSKKIKGVIFDMDGTLTKPCIDFKKMRQRLGIEVGDVLTVIHSYDDPKKREEAFNIIDEVESEVNFSIKLKLLAREKLEIQEGLHELLGHLDKHGIKRGIITRNSPKAIDHFISKLGYDNFFPKLSRDFLPFKPDPAGAKYICKHWGLEPHEVLFVGDFKDDLICGKAAGNFTCLLNNSNNQQFRELADVNVHRLDELIEHLEAILHEEK